LPFEYARSNALKRRGFGGTKPKVLVPLLPAGAHVIIITDGCVESEQVLACDQLLQSREFQRVEVHFVGTGGEMNLSVSAPFTRNTHFYQLMLDGQQMACGSTHNSVDLSKYFGKPGMFLQDANQLLQNITMQNLGSQGNPSLRTELLALQKSLMNELASVNSATRMARFEGLRQILCEQRYSDALVHCSLQVRFSFSIRVV
jgi:hypothetical protein